MKIPKSASELPKFEEVPDQQAEIMKWIREFEQVAPPITASLKRVAERMGYSHQTAISKYYAWKASEDWHVLINYAKLSYHDKSRLRLFYPWWQKLCAKNKTVKEAYRKFERLFKAGEAIPGISPTGNRERMPQGLDYNSLIRHAPKGWSIWRRAANGERLSVINCEAPFELKANLREIISSGDAIADIKSKGKIVSARDTLALLADAGLKIVRANSNPESTV